MLSGNNRRTVSNFRRHCCDGSRCSDNVSMATDGEWNSSNSNSSMGESSNGEASMSNGNGAGGNSNWGSSDSMADNLRGDVGDLSVSDGLSLGCGADLARDRLLDGVADLSWDRVTHLSGYRVAHLSGYRVTLLPGDGV